MTNVLVVYKKNFESIHDESLEQLKSILEEMKSNHQLRIELRARERVRRADFIGRDLVMFSVEMEHSRQYRTTLTKIHPSWV